MVAIRLAACLALLALAASAAAAAPSWYELLRAARVELGRGELPAAKRDLEQVDSIVGGHAGAQFALASIAARQGDREAALRHLEAYARTGMARDVARDTIFALLRGDPAFTAVSAELQANARPMARAEIGVRLADPTLLTEDVAWDAARRRFLVSSIHQGRIVSVARDGALHDFLPAGAAGVWGVYALAIDPGRGRLWATTAASPTWRGYVPADSGRTAVLAYDLRGGRRLARVELPRDGGRHVLGDMTLGRDGTVYVTESLGGGVYRLRPGAARLDTLARSGTFVSPQTPVTARDGRRLLVADYARGLAALDLAGGEVRWLDKPRTLASVGIDGLYRAGDRLIAIQNGTAPHRVLELTLDRDETAITGWRVIEQASEWLGEPNHGTWVGDDFWFIGTSGWERVGHDETLAMPAGARAPVLLRLKAARGAPGATP